LQSSVSQHQHRNINYSRDSMNQYGTHFTNWRGDQKL
jgi:hypothetical protein